MVQIVATAKVMEAPVTRLPTLARPSALPALVLADGTLEGLKWLGVVLMTVDHVDKYLLHESVPVMFAFGRLALPLFGFVLAYNLARPKARGNGTYTRTLRRLAVAGLVATVPSIALGGLGWGWWPLNVMWMLAAAVAVMYLTERGGRGALAAAGLAFLVIGGFVEFWWPGIALCLGAWRYCKRPSCGALAVWIGSTAALFIINRNFWALAAIPVILVATQIRLTVPRTRFAFYVYYPAHLCAVWAIRQWLF
jgi:hypothetical protein